MSSPWDVEASNSAGTSEIPPEGNHPATLIALIDLGTHEEDYQGKNYEARKALLCWELSAEMASNGKPFVVMEQVNVMPKISGKSKLRQILEQWRGKPLADGERINLAVLLGKSCLINIGHGKSSKGNAYAKILGISPLVRGMQAPTRFHEPYEWHFDGGPLAVPDWIPWVYGESAEDVIARAKEMKGAWGNQPAAAGVGTNGSAVQEDEIPF